MKKLLTLFVAVCFLWGGVRIQPTEAKVWEFQCTEYYTNISRTRDENGSLVSSTFKHECDDDESFISDLGFWGLVMGGMALGITTYMLVQHNQGAGFLPEEIPAIEPTFQFENEQMGVKYNISW